MKQSQVLLLMIFFGVVLAMRRRVRPAWSGAVTPTQIPRVTLPFGATTTPYSPSNPHTGTDWSSYAGSEGDSCRSSWSGSVTESAFKSNYGHFVTIKTVFPDEVWARGLDGRVRTLPAGSTVHTTYMHLRSRSHLSVNDVVTAGQFIAEVGATGRAYGAHVHQRCTYGGDRVDPLDLLIATIPGLRTSVIYV